MTQVIPESLRAGITLAAATMDPIVPPSIMMVIYAFMANASIGRLFFAGILPGVLMGLTLMVQIYCLVTTKGDTVLPKCGRDCLMLSGFLNTVFLPLSHPWSSYSGY